MKPLLFPCSVIRRETLPAAMEEAGIPMKCLASYNTVANPDIVKNLQALLSQEVHVQMYMVLFTDNLTW